MDALGYYTKQSIITDPKEYRSLYDEIPDDIAGISQVVRGLIMHFLAHGIQPAPDRMPQVDSREVPVMLKTILDYLDAPLSAPRALEHKLVGCCRDFATLSVSILRHKGVPARVRYGTANYFESGYNIDHAIVEYWDTGRKGWRKVDTQLDQSDDWGIDPYDVKEDQFITAAEGWLKAIDGVISPDKVGLGTLRQVNGWAFLLLELQLDLASLNKMELLCWDAWGISTKYEDFDEGKLSTREFDLLYDTAKAIQERDMKAIQALYQHPLLKLSNPLWSFSPAVNPQEYPKIFDLELINE